MPTSLTELSQTMQTLFGETANRLARASGFIQRERKLTGASFASGLVFGWLGDEQATLSQLRQAIRHVGVGVSRQAIAQRFTPAAVDFMRALLNACLAVHVEGERQTHPSLSPFSAIYLVDSTTVKLPDELLSYWQATEGSGVKLSVCWDLQRGSLPYVELHDAIEHDRRASFLNERFPEQTLFEADLAYFKLAYFRQLSAQGVYWLSRYKMGTCLFDADGKTLNLFKLLNELADDAICCCPVQLGLHARLPCYLLAQRASPEQEARHEDKLLWYEHKKQRVASPARQKLCAYIVYLTTVPPAVCPPTNLLAIARLRWQIELLFRLWKTDLDIDDWRTRNPYRILCELYAKLIAALVQHWLFALANVHHLQRSMIQARASLRQFSWFLLYVLFDPTHLLDALTHLLYVFRGCAICSSPARPSNLHFLDP